MKALTLLIKTAMMLGIFSVLSGTMKDSVLGMFDSVGVQAAHAEMERLHGKLMEYYTLHNRYPQTAQELRNYFRAEFDKPIQEVLTDPWENAYYFFTPKYEIVCFGPDTKQQTNDDFGIAYPQQVTAAIQQRKQQDRQFYQTWKKMYEASKRLKRRR